MNFKSGNSGLANLLAIVLCPLMLQFSPIPLLADDEVKNGEASCSAAVPSEQKPDKESSLCPVKTATEQKPLPVERILLNDLLAEIGNPEISGQIRILEKFDKFFLRAPSVSEPPYIPDAKEKEQGFVLFPRRLDQLVYCNSSPAKRSQDALDFSGARGASSFGFLGILPLKEIRDLNISISPLVNSEGDALSAASVRIYLARHLFSTEKANIFFPEPFGLQPIPQKVSFKEGIAQSFGIDLSIPSDAKPGNYSGMLTVNADGKTASVPLKLKVWDFEIISPKSSEMNWGFFYGGLKTKMDADFLAANGVTSIVMDASLDDSFFSLVKQLREWGIKGTLLLNVGKLESSINPPPPSAYGKEWEKGYFEVLKTFDSKMREAGESDYIGLIWDEPRETMLNPWNRSYAQTMSYHKVIGEALPEMRRAVNPMTDNPTQECPEGLYVKFADSFEVVIPHYWAPCKGIIAAAKNNPKTALWSYNDGCNRLAWGLHSWARGVKGRLIYEYRAYHKLEHPLSPIYMSSREFEGRSYTGANVAIAWQDEIWPTVKMIALREGVMDYKYVYTLEKAMEKSKNEKAKEDAAKFLEELRKEVPEYAHSDKFSNPEEVDRGDPEMQLISELDATREKICALIMELSK